MNATELKVQMIRKCKSAEQMYEAIGISSAAWYRKIGGKSEFTQGEITKIRQELNLTDAETTLIFFSEEVS